MDHPHSLSGLSVDLFETVDISLNLYSLASPSVADSTENSVEHTENGNGRVMMMLVFMTRNTAFTLSSLL